MPPSPSGQRFAGSLVADAVAERAVNAGLGVVKRQRADAAHAVAQPKPELPRAVGVLRRRDVQLLCLAAALDRNGRFAAVKLRERRFEVLRRADVGSAQPRYDVALF